MSKRGLMLETLRLSFWGIETNKTPRVGLVINKNDFDKAWLTSEVGQEALMRNVFGKELIRNYHHIQRKFHEQEKKNQLHQKQG